jgi:hypothetical protein
MQQRWWHSMAFALVSTLATTQAKAQDITFGTLPALQVSTPIPQGTHVPGDMDGNGVSDLFWFNPSTSQFAYWLMDTNDATGAVTRIGSRTFNITPGYFVGAIGDFNGDGLADVVFTSNNHDLYLWTNNGSGGFTSKQLASYPAGWLLVGAGDIDGDGQDDLLWLNPSQCEFGYWLMKNGVPTTTKAVKIACGYYPLSIGYYTPTNRLSIIWTSALNDLYVWDSAGNGFASYSLGTYGQNNMLVAIGGGFAGGAYGYALSRVFNASLQQSSYIEDIVWDGGVVLPLSSAGYLIEGRGTNLPGLIYEDPQFQRIGVCPPAGGIPGAENGPAPYPESCPFFSYPQGWYVIGALANGVVPVPNSSP